MPQAKGMQPAISVIPRARPRVVNRSYSRHDHQRALDRGAALPGDRGKRCCKAGVSSSRGQDRYPYAAAQRLSVFYLERDLYPSRVPVRNAALRTRQGAGVSLGLRNRRLNDGGPATPYRILVGCRSSTV